MDSARWRRAQQRDHDFDNRVLRRSAAATGVGRHRFNKPLGKPTLRAGSKRARDGRRTGYQSVLAPARVVTTIGVTDLPRYARYR